jgi:hypothetical protein
VKAPPVQSHVILNVGAKALGTVSQSPQCREAAKAQPKPVADITTSALHHVHYPNRNRRIGKRNEIAHASQVQHYFVDRKPPVRPSLLFHLRKTGRHVKEWRCAVAEKDLYKSARVTHGKFMKIGGHNSHQWFFLLGQRKCDSQGNSPSVDITLLHCITV